MEDAARVCAISPLKRLERFLIIGPGGTFYTSDTELNLENANNAIQAIEEDPNSAAEVVKSVSVEGRASRQTATLFVLAMFTSHKSSHIRKVGRKLMPDVLRTFTFRAEFLTYHQKLGGGWGRGFRSALALLDRNRSAVNVLYDYTKYRNRHGWTPRDVARKVHPKFGAAGKSHEFVFRSMCSDWKVLDDYKLLEDDDAPTLKCREMLETFNKMQKMETTPEEVARLLPGSGLTWEHINSTALASPLVWQALVTTKSLPLGAMLRNIVRMLRNGTFESQACVDLVVERLTDADAIAAARIHPFNVLLAIDKVKDESSEIAAALEKMFMLSFGSLTKTEAKMVLAVDVSGSMSYNFIDGTHISACKAAAVMAAVGVRTAEDVIALAFSSKLVEFKLTADMSVTDVMSATSGILMGTTDCSAPIKWARENKYPADAFVIYTDNETNSGSPPMVELELYRKEMERPNTKLIVVAFTATKFSIADPEDPYTMDIAGFDAAGPRAIEAMINL